MDLDTLSGVINWIWGKMAQLGQAVVWSTKANPLGHKKKANLSYTIGGLRPKSKA